MLKDLITKYADKCRLTPATLLPCGSYLVGFWDDCSAEESMLSQLDDGTYQIITFSGYDYGGGVNYVYSHIPESVFVQLLEEISKESHLYLNYYIRTFNPLDDYIVPLPK